MPVEIVKRAWRAISLPWSQVMLRRITIAGQLRSWSILAPVYQVTRPSRQTDGGSSRFRTLTVSSSCFSRTFWTRAGSIPAASRSSAASMGELTSAYFKKIL
jgi:hypothetical protein